MITHEIARSIKNGDTLYTFNPRSRSHPHPIIRVRVTGHPLITRTRFSIRIMITLGRFHSIDHRTAHGWYLTEDDARTAARLYPVVYVQPSSNAKS